MAIFSPLATGKIVISKQEQAELKRLVSEHNSKSARFTEPRQIVYLFVRRAENKGISAYQILDLMKEYNPKAKPMMVYRALDFLLQAELIVKIESKSKFVAREPKNREDLSIFMICAHCGSVNELVDKDSQKYIEMKTIELGYSLEKKAIEIPVICSNC